MYRLVAAYALLALVGCRDTSPAHEIRWGCVGVEQTAEGPRGFTVPPEAPHTGPPVHIDPTSITCDPLRDPQGHRPVVTDADRQRAIAAVKRHLGLRP